MLTSELVYPFMPSATPSTMTQIGRGMSLISVIIALWIGIKWDKALTDLAKVQFGISLQCVPTFLVGLFAIQASDCHPWSLAVGALSGGILTLSLYFGYLDNNPNAYPMDTGVVALFSNCALVFVIEIARRLATGTLYGARKAIGSKKLPPVQEEEDANDSGSEEQGKDSGFVMSSHVPRVSIVAMADESSAFNERPDWDKPKMTRFGDYPLTPTVIWKSMEGTWEPFTSPALVFLLLFMATITIPIGPGSVPPLDANGTFVFLPDTIRGIPYWAFMMIMLSIVAYSVVVIMIYNLPLNFANSVLDPDTIELLPKEMEKRTSYDEANISAQMRRSVIRENIVSILETEKHVIDNEHRRRISELVSGEFSI